MTYKKKLLANFLAIFTLFAILVIFIQYSRERSYKQDSLESNLIAYSDIIYNYLSIQTDDSSKYDRLKNILPEELRITVINNNGEVIFDNNKQGIAITDNHSDRPEVMTANVNGVGRTIRKSDSTGREYFYLAKKFDNYFVRVALPYDLNIRTLLKGDNLYIYFIIALFIIVAFSLLMISDKLGRSISALRDFAFSLSNGNINRNFIFPEGELGEIGQKLVENYRSLESGREELRIEKDKLIKHFTYSTAGIAFFSSQKKAIYNNSLFMSNLNMITDEHTLNTEDIFSINEYAKSLEFISSNQLGVFEDVITKNGLFFNLRTIVFDDGSIEIILNNTTNEEKNRRLKQEMTSNIAHELRTPVSSISGYLETMLECELEPQKSRQFIERTYSQVQRLAGLIRDISIITKIEEKQTEVEQEKINVRNISNDVIEELSEEITKRGVTIENNLPTSALVKGNSNLLYAIFRNLIDNSLNYAGDGITIKINLFMEDSNFFYFSLSDNGKGVSEKHLPRIFDRFYRVSEGRTRKDGGTGLGLAIVKNSVLFHGGTVSAKKSAEGGVEVIFTIAKKD